jgi:hypothetical protein
MVPEDISVALTLVKASRKTLAMHLHAGSAAGWRVNTTLSGRVIGWDCQS